MTARTVYWGGMNRTPEGVERLRAVARARQRAHNIVAQLHRDEFYALWTDRGRSGEPGYDSRRAAAERAVAHNHPEDFARVFAAEKAREGVAS